jgi:hypothetical protein
LLPEQEDELVNVILDLETRLFGLTPQDIRKLVFDYCMRNNIANCFKNGAAGYDWFCSFMSRHPQLSIRKPEATSIHRALGFNRTKVDLFYSVLKQQLYNGERRKIPATNIYNVDESGFTICQKPKKIVAKRGKRGVGMLTSAEKGKTVTAVCCVSAAGTFVPPMLIFPRARMRAELIDKAPPGSVGAANPSGWISSELFLEWFSHFVKFVQPATRPEPILLIMDGHASHTKNIQLIEEARKNNVIILSLPSHCTHRLQPLDISFFKSLNTYYDDEIRCWLRAHPGRAVTEYQIGELFGTAYMKAATLQNGVSGFQKSGIEPFCTDLFTDADFAASDVFVEGHDTAAIIATINESIPVEPLQQSTELSVVPVSPNITDAGSTSERSDSTLATALPVTDQNEVLPARLHVSPPIVVSMDVNNVTVHDTNSANTSPFQQEHNKVPTVSTVNHCSFSSLMPTPTTSRPQANGRKRLVAHATVITSSPYKNELSAKRSKGKNQNEELSTTKTKKQGKEKQPVAKPSKQPRAKQVKKKTKNCNETVRVEDDVTCLYCGQLYSSSSEEWIKCSECGNWADTVCADVNSDTIEFICELCRSY